jgi:glycerol-3-phosphate dehydrogenase (NAD+)
MRKFAHTFFSDINMQTFFESCGVADLIVTCFSGRNRKVSEAFVVTKKVRCDPPTPPPPPLAVN